jgi:WD40 repeat protein
VKVWDTGTGQEVLAFHHAAGIWTLAFSPDSRRLAAAGGNSTVKVWDLTAGNEALVLRGHTETVSAVAFSPDGWRLTSGGGDGVVKIWDATTPAETATLSGALPTINDVAFSPDGRRLAIANSVNTVRVLDTTTGMEVLVLRGHGGGVVAVAYDPDGRQIASAGQDRTVRVWDATSGAEILCLRNYDAIIQGLAFGAHGRWLATTGFRPARPARPPSREVTIWNVSNGEKVLTLPVYGKPGETERFAGIAFSPDGDRLADGAGRDVRIWEAGTDRLLLTLSGHEGHVRCVAYSPDGRRIASAGEDRCVRVWDSATGKELLILRGHTSPISGLAYSPDGRRIVTTAGGSSKGGERIEEGVKIWDALTGQEILTLHGAPGQSPRVTFDAGGGRLAASGDSVVTIWEKASLAEELHEERQAASLVRHRHANLPSREAVVARIRDDNTISDTLRQRALGLAEPLWQSRVRAQAENRVYSLLRDALLRPEIVARLRADPALSEPVRQEALALAERVVEGPTTFNQASRAVANRPGATPAAYQRAEQQAEIVCRLMPFEGSYQTTLGMAQYRLGKYQQALTTLTHADELNQSADGGSIPADLAFLTMTRYQMRERDRAQASLGQLRQTMQKAIWAQNVEAQGLLKEAEALLAGRASQPEK